MNAAHLLLHPVDDLGAALPTLVTAMPEPRSISGVAVGVDEHAAAGRLDEHRQRGADAVGDVRPSCGPASPASAARGSR